MAHCHPADGSLVRVERWGFEGKSPKTRVSLLKGGHVLSLNYVLKSDMDLRNEQRAAKEKQLKQEAVRCLLVLKTGLSCPIYQYYLKYNTETARGGKNFLFFSLDDKFYNSRRQQQQLHQILG